MILPKIISSGIPGAESAALDVAIQLQVPYGGFAMDNSMLDAYRATRRYKLWEKSFQTSRSKDEANLHIADATLIFTHGELNRDLFFIDDYTVTHGRPSYHIDFNVTDPLQAAFQISIWADKHNPKSIFVAGSRERVDKEIYRATFDTLFSFISLKRGDHPDPDRLTVDKKPWPETVGEAVENLMELLALKDKVAIASMNTDEVADLNLTLGNFIRNSFGLWADNQELMRSCSQAAGREIAHRDTASVVILKNCSRSFSELTGCERYSTNRCSYSWILRQRVEDQMIALKTDTRSISSPRAGIYLARTESRRDRPDEPSANNNLTARLARRYRSARPHKHSCSH